MTSASIADPPAADDGASNDLPPLFRRHIRRPRLTRQLDASKSRMLMLTAPAGYGKTTLAAEWLQPRPPEDVAWYQATTASADVAALSAGIAEAAAHILPAGERLRQRLTVPQPPKDPAKTYAELLAADFAKWPKSAWLVIDDYHHLARSTACEQFVEELVARCPVRLLVTTRTRPCWATARRILYGEIEELDHFELAMTNSEAGKLLGASVSEADASSTPMSGWPVLLGLAALAESEPRKAKGTSAIFRYFAEEILEREEGVSRRFMLASAVPPYMTAALARTIENEVDAHPDEMRKLVDTGLVSEQRKGRYYFHPLLKEFLLDTGHETEPELIESVARRVCAQLVDQGASDDALVLAEDLNRLDLADRVLEQWGLALIDRGRLATIDQWLARFEKGTYSSANVLMLRAELLVRRGRYREAEAIARAAIADIDAEDPRVSRLWCLVGRANHLLCDGYRASEAYQGATQTATSEKVAAEAAWGGLVTAIELEVEGLQEQLEAFERVAPSSPDYQIRVGLGRFLTKSLDQSIERGWDDVESARLLTGVASDPMIISNVHNVAIWTAMLRARYRDAISYANEAISYCTAYDLEFAQAYCLCNRAAAFVGVGRYAEARRDLSTLQDHLRTHPDPYLALMTAAAETKISLIAPAHAWSRRARQPATEPQTWEATGDEPVARVALGYLLAHTAMADIKEGQIQRARERAERATKASRHVAVQTGASLASALADATAGRSGQSKPLSEALILAGKMGCLDFVVTVQRAFPELTREAREEGALHVLQVALTNSDGGIARARDDRLTALTKREREVAELLAAGLSNRDIARRLVIEPSTAKVHVRRVMKKLGVDSRLAAALRLRELTEEEAAAQGEGAG